MHSDLVTVSKTTPPVMNSGLTDGPTLERRSKTADCAFKWHGAHLGVRSSEPQTLDCAVVDYVSLPSNQNSGKSDQGWILIGHAEVIVKP